MAETELERHTCPVYRVGHHSLTDNSEGCILLSPHDCTGWSLTDARVLRWGARHSGRTGSGASTLPPSDCSNHPQACLFSPKTHLQVHIVEQKAKIEATGHPCIFVSLLARGRE
jgi:hypothetical protein